MSIEDLLDQSASSNPTLTLWLPGQPLTAARLVSWDRASGLLVCRGGHGFTDDDVHYLRSSHILGVTLRQPAQSPAKEPDRLSPEVRDAIRLAAGYPLSLAIRANAFVDQPAALASWLESIVAAITLLEPLRDALQSQVDQILLREGDTLAVLGGSTLILEAAPSRIPTPDQLRAAIDPLLR